MQQAELAALHARAQAYFASFPGVIGVGFGKKEVAGTTTTQGALRIYVIEKKAAAALPEAERIPATFEGYPTDVVTPIEEVPTPCSDQTQHSPLIGGIYISNNKPTDTFGTLGFFATIDGVAGPENVVLVSNNHVLADGGAVVGSTIYHPEWENLGSGPKEKIGTGPIGKIDKLGQAANHSFAYPGKPADDYFVDCATAKLDISIASTCNSNCGVSYKNAIRDLNIGGNSRITGVAQVTQADLDAPGDYEVYKVGARTSRTHGKIVEIAHPGSGGKKNIILIEVIGTDCDNIVRFCFEGDSGSAIINAQNQLVGLLYARGDGANLKYGLASHIHPVMDLLKVTPISTQNPPVGPAGEARSDSAGGFARQYQDMAPVRDRFVATPVGAEIYARFMAHRAEVVALVNHARPVTVAWHRSKGPAFLAHAMENLRDAAHEVPETIDGVSRRAMLARMADVLTTHGSAPLKMTLAEWSPRILGSVDRFASLHDLVASFEAEMADG